MKTANAYYENEIKKKRVWNYSWLSVVDTVAVAITVRSAVTLLDPPFAPVLDPRFAPGLLFPILLSLPLLLPLILLSSTAWWRLITAAMTPTPIISRDEETQID
jgi:hypothetical protein